MLKTLPHRATAAAAVAVLVVLALSCSGCESGPPPGGASTSISVTPSVTAPPSTAPWSVSGLTLPEGAGEIAAVLLAIPSENRGEVDYARKLGRFAPVALTFVGGGKAGIQVLHWDEVRAWPGKPGSIPFLKMLLAEEGMDVEGKDLAPSEPVVWVAAVDTTVELSYGIAFGDPTSQWVFEVSAPSAEEREEALALFADAARTVVAE